jgi:pimeloyl-ACP methyl ester carboxylesterase
VPLRHDDPSAGTLHVRVRVVGAGRLRDSSKAPIFLLAGGPGQSAYELAPAIAAKFQAMARDRDLVFVEQRGTGKESELACDLDEIRPMRLRHFLAPNREDVEFAQRCLKNLKGDPADFQTADFVADLDLIRRTLGYEKIALYGVSYGTRAALAYLEAHAADTELAILDAAAPADLNLMVDPLLDTEAAIEAWIESCGHTNDCAERFPTLRANFKEVVAMLERGPVALEMVNPWTAQPEHVEIHLGNFYSILRASAYTKSSASRIPFAISEAAQGKWLPMAGMVASGGEGGIAIELYYSILCQEDAHAVASEKLQAAKESPLAAVMLHSQVEICEYWKSSASSKPAHGQFTVDTPMLVLSGELDPVTSPKWGSVAASYSQRSQHVVLPGNGHGAFYHACSPQIIGGFLKSPSSWKLEASDETCLQQSKRQHFFVSPLGPSVYPLADSDEKESESL